MMDLIDFEWMRCLDGYELVDTSKRAPRRWLVRGASPFAIAAKSQRFEIYRPLKVSALFDVFAKTQPTAEGMLRFANVYGLIGTTSRPSGRSRSEARLDELLAHHAAMREAVESFEKRDVDELLKRCNESGYANAAIRLQLDDGGAIRVALVPGSLIQAMWLQLALHASSGAELLRCERCNAPFVVGPRTGRRNTSKYCSNACKVAAFKRQKHGPELAKAERRARRGSARTIQSTGAKP
jgi:hypothetical protein